MAARGKLRTIGLGYVAWCPGCKTYHKIGTSWHFNGDFDRPTFSPSVLVRGVVDAEKDPTPVVCHSFIQDGRWVFLNDCTHNLASKTVEIRSEIDLP
jgi:Family of unknown function (DUF6527)